MLTNLAYFKLLKSLPEDTLSNVNSQLVLLAAAGALNKVPDSTQDIAVNDLLASADFLKQQGLLECLTSQFPLSTELPTSLSSPTRPTTSAQSSSAAVTSASSPERTTTPPATQNTGQTTPLQRSPNSHCSPKSTTPVKVEPGSPTSTSKVSFRPLVTSKASPTSTSNNTHTSTVHWDGSNTGPPPNKTCTSTTTSNLSKLHPCDTTILNLLNPYKNSLESKLSKYCLKQGETSAGSTVVSTLSNIDWSATSTPRSYNCYWLSHVGPCNRQFLDKDDLYKHLKSHVNDLEALTPATAILQPINPPSCMNCNKNRGFSKINGRYQPYSKCNKFSRCACRR